MATLTAERPNAPYKRPVLNPWRREAILGYLFAMPWIFGFFALALGPMLFSLYASFTRYSITLPPQWIGLDNYQFLFTEDPRFKVALYNTFYYVIVKTPLAITVALGAAMLLHMKLPGQRIFRTVFYMPTVLTGVAAIFLWIWVLNPVGLLNRFLGLFGIHGPNWCYDPAWAKGGLIVMSLWYIGGAVLIFLAGLNGIPGHLYEAAEIDGAGSWAKFWNVTIPLLSPTIFYQVVTSIIGAFQVFNSAFVISTSIGTQQPGDPAQSLLFYEVYLYMRAFQKMEMGFACSMAWILFAIIMLVTGIQLWLSNRWVYYES